MLRHVAVGVLGAILSSACIPLPDFPPLPQDPPPLGSATDVDGNTYPTVVIGTQEWMAGNLKATRYNDGTPIPITEDAFVWANLSTGSYSWYDDDIANKDVYGALYNWYVIQYLQLRSRIDDICPTNFYLPSRDVWAALVDALGGAAVASGALKETGTAHWAPPNTGATNQSSFAALPGGNRDAAGSFVAKGQSGSWWGSDDSDAPDLAVASSLYLDDASTTATIATSAYEEGLAIRCMRDVTPN
ncbi:MAG TPA: fibrobacter succinogenes major paralogous domain-containing protein [Polyangia bacterium]|jgi:uncharacterized protein (TIGR02145 family)